MENKGLRVFLADDHPLLRMALRISLTQAKGIEVVGEASDGYTAVELILASRPDVAVLDVEMPGLSGIRAIRVLRKTLPLMKIVVLSNYNREEYVREAIEAGADGYVLKRVGIDELVRIIKDFGLGKSVVSAYLANLSLGYHPHEIGHEKIERPMLTPREKEVLQALAEGKSNKELSEKLHISIDTVKSHIKNIYGKLNIKNRAEAAKLALEMNLLQ